MAPSDDEYSDLTDLDELSPDYEETIKSSKKKGRGRGKPKTGEYRIRHALKAPRATTYSTEALYKQIHNGDIDLEPEYQREVVWPESKQIGIIDSIFRNFYIPPVIFAVNALDDGTETRTCIDGKQRLTSIHRFMEGLIPHKDSLTGDKLWYRDNPDHRTRTAKKILPEKYRNMFDGKAVVCVEYQDLEDADEREIFQRVQLGVALTPAEKLKVLSTPRAQFVRCLQDDYLNNDASGLGGAALAWDRSRGSDFRCLAQTIQCIAINPKNTSIQATEKWLADPTEMESAFAASIENTYSVYETLVRDPKNASAFAKIAPIEFIMIGILVHRHKGRLTLEALGKAVKDMRAYVRKTHDDIRNNGKVYKTMNAFIDDYKGPAAGKGEVCAADKVGAGYSGVALKAAGSNGKTAGAGTKRKAARGADEDDDDGDGLADDSDDDYAPARRAAPAPRKRANASTKKAAAAPAAPPAPAAASSMPTPPGSTASPPVANANNAVDVIQAAKARIEAQQRLAQAQGQAPQSTTMLPSPSPSFTPFSWNPANYGQQQQPHAFPPFPPQQQPQQTQAQHGHGAAGVAAAFGAATLEQGLMGAASGGSGGGGRGANTPPAGPKVKSEPGSGGVPPFGGGSGSRSYDGGSRYGRGGGSGGYDRDSRDRRHDGYDDYGRGDKRYREREGGHERGRW